MVHYQSNANHTGNLVIRIEGISVFALSFLIRKEIYEILKRVFYRSQGKNITWVSLNSAVIVSTNEVGEVENVDKAFIITIPLPEDIDRKEMVGVLIDISFTLEEGRYNNFLLQWYQVGWRDTSRQYL